MSAPAATRTRTSCCARGTWSSSGQAGLHHSSLPKHAVSCRAGMPLPPSWEQGQGSVQLQSCTYRQAGGRAKQQHIARTCVAARGEVLGWRQICVHHTAPLLATGRFGQRDPHLEGVGVEGGVQAAAALAPAARDSGGQRRGGTQQESLLRRRLGLGPASHGAPSPPSRPKTACLSCRVNARKRPSGSPQRSSCPVTSCGTGSIKHCRLMAINRTRRSDIAAAVATTATSVARERCRPTAEPSDEAGL